MSYITRRDADNALSRLEGCLDDLSNADIESLSSAYEDVRSAFSNLESEMSYLSGEHEEFDDLLEEIESRMDSRDPDDWDLPDDDELDDLRERAEAYDDLMAEFGSVNEALEANAELAKLRTQVENLTQWHDNQGMVIRALLDRLGQVNKLVDSNAIGDLIFNATQPEALVLIEDLPGDDG